MLIIFLQVFLAEFKKYSYHETERLTQPPVLSSW